MDKIWKWAVLISLCFFGYFTLGGYGVRVNRSGSLPQIIFISTPVNSDLTKEQIVAFEHPDLEAVFGKILIGFPGDRISIQDETVFINDRKIGLYKTISHTGKIYHPISQGIVPEEHYFVYTPHEESFDSRYEEFGLIKKSWIKEVLWPLF